MLFSIIRFCVPLIIGKVYDLIVCYSFNLTILDFIPIVRSYSKQSLFDTDTAFIK